MYCKELKERYICMVRQQMNKWVCFENKPWKSSSYLLCPLPFSSLSGLCVLQGEAVIMVVPVSSRHILIQAPAAGGQAQ